MKIGSRVRHHRLGEGVILEFCKYGGVLVNFSDDTGILVRVVKLADLEVINGK